MRKILSIVLIFAMLTVTLISATPVFAADSTISIELDLTTAQQGDIVNATIRLQNITPQFITVPIRFNPDVVQIVDNNGDLVLSRVKTSAQVRNGSAGLTPGQALSNEWDENYEPIFWNGGIFENPQYPEIDNENGFIRLMFNNMTPRAIGNETLISVRFVVVGVGNADIRFAAQGDTRYEPASPTGATFLPFTPPGSMFTIPSEPFSVVNTQSLTATPNPDAAPPTVQEEPQPGTETDNTTAVITVPSQNENTLIYEFTVRQVENFLPRAFGETDSELNIRFEAPSNITTFIIRMPVRAVDLALDSLVFSTEYETPLGTIGFDNFDVLDYALPTSQFVIATLSATERSVTIDGVPIGHVYVPYVPTVPDGTNGGTDEPITPIPADSIAHWAESYIRFVIENEIMIGFPDGTFRPNGSITRAEFSTAFARFLGISAGSITFSDTESHWASGYIAAMADRGIVGGVGDNLFAPDELITREQIAAILHRTSGMDVEAAVGNTFNDDDQISDWARNSVYTIRNVGIMQGDNIGNFNPQNGATRAEVAAILARLTLMMALL